MAKKQTTNRFRNWLADYYLTNRAITKEDDERYRKEKESGVRQPWTAGEKTMAWVTGIAAVLLLVRWIFF